MEYLFFFYVAGCAVALPVVIRVVCHLESPVSPLAGAVLVTVVILLWPVFIYIIQCVIVGRYVDNVIRLGKELRRG